MSIVHVVAQTIVVIAMVILLILAVQCARARYWVHTYWILSMTEIVLMLEFAQSNLPARLGLSVSLAVADGFFGAVSVAIALLFRALRAYNAHETDR